MPGHCQHLCRRSIVYRLSHTWSELFFDARFVCDVDECHSVPWTFHRSCSGIAGRCVPITYDDHLGCHRNAYRQQFESNFISPNVMGRVLHLHPLTVITVILAAGSIGGFLGILFAVPIYAVIKTTVVHFYQTYQESKTSKDDALI